MKTLVPSQPSFEADRSTLCRWNVKSRLACDASSSFISFHTQPVPRRRYASHLTYSIYISTCSTVTPTSTHLYRSSEGIDRRLSVSVSLKVGSRVRLLCTPLCPQQLEFLRLSDRKRPQETLCLLCLAMFGPHGVTVSK